MSLVLTPEWLEKKIKEIDERIREIQKKAIRRPPKIPKRPAITIPAFMLPGLDALKPLGSLQTLAEEAAKKVGYSLKIPTPEELEKMVDVSMKTKEEAEKGAAAAPPAPPAKPTPPPAPPEYKIIRQEEAGHLYTSVQEFLKAGGLRPTIATREDIAQRGLVLSPTSQEKLQKAVKTVEPVVKEGKIEEKDVPIVQKVVQEAAKVVGIVAEPVIRTTTLLTERVREGVQNAINFVKGLFGW